MMLFLRLNWLCPILKGCTALETGDCYYYRTTSLTEGECLWRHESISEPCRKDYSYWISEMSGGKVGANFSTLPRLCSDGFSQEIASSSSGGGFNSKFSNDP